MYDINKNRLNETIFKGDNIPKNKYIIVVMVFIQNSKNEFLIQKRSKNKNGKYALTGGHPKSGETSIQGMCTEIKEEIGLDVNEEELELIYEGIEKEKGVFFDIYYLKKEFKINELKLQKEEVELVKWVKMDEIIELINKDLFFENHAEEVYRMLNIFKEKGIEI